MMPLIRLETKIQAAIDVCFDLSRSIDLHKRSTVSTGETAVDGVTQGLIGPGETVTWRAKHLGVWQQLTTKITAYERPFHFCDEQVQGIFKRLKHDHFFIQQGSAVLMTDHFWFESPLGHLFDALFLKKYLTGFLVERNRVIKDCAEHGGWRQFL